MIPNESFNTEIRVKFELEVEDGFPPISAETMIGVMMKEDNLVRIDNTPFFITGIAIGDVVQCYGVAPVLIFDHLHSCSGNKALSIIFIDASYSENLYQSLKDLGCYCEFGEFPEYDMLAVSVPLERDYEEIRLILELLERQGKISFAELCIR